MFCHVFVLMVSKPTTTIRRHGTHHSINGIQHNKGGNYCTQQSTNNEADLANIKSTANKTDSAEVVADHQPQIIHRILADRLYEVSSATDCERHYKETIIDRKNGKSNKMICVSHWIGRGIIIIVHGLLY